jgi:hypothetical protein
MPFGVHDLSDHSGGIDSERLPPTTGSLCFPLNGHERSEDEADAARSEAETWPLSETLPVTAPPAPVTGRVMVGSIEVVWTNGVTWLAIWEGEGLDEACARAEVIWQERGCRVRVLERSLPLPWSVFREWPAR